MFIGHLPAGYLLTRWLQRRLKTREFLWVGLLASIFPDLDMLYFYLIDDQKTLHHHYWTHLPLIWIALWILLVILARVLKNRTVFILVMIIFANLVLHFALDSIVGGISWLYPFFEYDLFLFTVPATHDFWVWSFVFHWTFLFEIAVILAAILTAYKHRSGASQGR
jgi:inner membrane protein